MVRRWEPAWPHHTHLHLRILHIKERLQTAFRSTPLIAFCRPKSLKDLLVWAQLTSAQRETPGNFRCGLARWKTCPIKPQEKYKGNNWCGQPRCKACGHIKTGATFHSSTFNQEFHVKATVDCRAKNVAYLIEYAKCSIQYVGETENALQVRLTGLQSNINHG